MKIIIEKDASRASTLYVPALWAMGRFGAFFIRIASGTRVVKGRDLVKLRRMIKRYRKDNPEWTVVEVISESGSRVMIRL